jgi:chromosome segregation protein
MFLKSLTLRGFKTFADATELEFGPASRITAIVGPNGCGKSNLMDATRWVLGEDNTRELRVASLENIIFSGTAARKPLSLAEVTLLFDNSSGKLPVAFTEVAIKRRTFREAESEFFINKNPCRLKDIKDLLLDTGLGEATYSIITQGKVDAILSSKGEERRAVFEEAAGINKYKTRKLSAEKKMISAEQNILRINDLKVEVGEQLLTLEGQARQAKEYLEMQNRVKEIELGLCKKLIGNLIEKRIKAEEELSRARQASAELETAEKQDEEKLSSLRAELRGLEVAIEEDYARLDSEKDRLRDAELDRRFLEGELQREERQLTEIEKKRDEIRQKAAAGAPPSPVLLGETVHALAEQAEKTVSLLASILSFLGKELPFSLVSPAEKEEGRQLKLELLQDEAERVRFALQAHRSELESLPFSAGGTSARDSLLESISHRKQERENLNQKISALEEKISRGRKSEISTSGLEVALAKIEGEMLGLQEKLSLEYNLTLEEIKNQPFEVSNISRAKIEVEEGRQRLRSLEPVNLLAIEEFEKARERLSFIELQLSDLNAACENLKNLIAELDTRAKETFIQTMQQLSLVFSETFSRLFAGGEARIALAPGQPALEAEIEISVRPSGRKWLPLPQLSGGERALSAIAILFSLLKVRPSPFCFLDEVDAALDEANINRFSSMLKDFSATSQIIVITHNKCTMAVADNIYGITMEEPGVSKIISMKLTEVTA